MIGSILVDTRPLRTSRPFARLYAGSLAGSLGTVLTQFAVLAGLCSGVITRTDRAGAAMTWPAVVWHIAVIMLGLAPNLIIGGVCAAAAALVPSWRLPEAWCYRVRTTV